MIGIGDFQTKMVNQNTYLDLWDFFINKIVGGENIIIFIGLSYIVIAFVAAKLRFPNIVTLAMFATYSIIISVFFQSILVITLFIIGIVIAFALGKVFDRWLGGVLFKTSFNIK